MISPLSYNNVWTAARVHLRLVRATLVSICRDVLSLRAYNTYGAYLMMTETYVATCRLSVCLSFVSVLPARRTWLVRWRNWKRTGEHQLQRWKSWKEERGERENTRRGIDVREEGCLITGRRRRHRLLLRWWRERGDRWRRRRGRRPQETDL